MHTGQKEEQSQVRECLRSIDEERDSLEDIMTSTLPGDLEKMYPEDLEVWLYIIAEREARQLIVRCGGRIWASATIFVL